MAVLKNKKWLTVGLLGGTSLLALFYVLHLPMQAHEAGTKRLVIFTLCSEQLSDEALPEGDYYRLYEPLQPEEASQGEKLLKTPGQLRRLAQHYEELYVLGAGLPPAFLAVLDSLPVKVQWLPALCEGVQAVEVTPKYMLDSLQVSVTWTGKPELSILLPNGSQTSIKTAATAQPFKERFSVAFSPLAWMPIGIVYESDTLWCNQPQLTRGNVRTLIIEGAPRAESKFLKSWIKKQGGEYALRSHMSEGVYAEEWHASEPMSLQKITPGVLAHFDWLLIDEAGWQSLSSQEQAWVLSEVKNKGLGVLWIFSEGNTRYPSYRMLPARVKEVRGTVRLENHTLGELPLGGWRIRTARGVLVLAADEKGQALTVCENYGRGKLAMTTIDNTYSWFLGGNIESYQRYWLFVAGALARPYAPEALWKLPAVAFARHRLDFRLYSKQSVRDAYVLEENTRRYPLNLTQQLSDTTVWQGAWYPPHEGFYQWVAIADKTTKVAQRGMWISRMPASWMAAGRYAYMEQWYQRQAGHPAKTKGAVKKAENKKMPAWVWAFIALGAMSAFWLWERLRT
ncbi:hypothetical protein [Thermonema rossianum]|uniref:hypothetical protein n=1 Tax=Thermonema rossianum TaxID=55505 RepID=UPI0012F9AE3C|nr:hypothetical protein [Thermonema rossianum]